MKKISFVLAVSAALLVSCQESMETFDSKVYIEGTAKTSTILLDGTAEVSKSLQASIPQPQAEALNITFGTDEGLVKEYNVNYFDQALMLPSSNYQFVNPQAVINPGAVKSTEVTVNFVNLNDLDSDNTYVLPVTIAQSAMTTLASDRTMFYVFKGASLINVVPNMKENSFSITWGNADVMNNLNQLTFECYCRADNWDGKEAGINSFVGIEGGFLFRAGDAGIPGNQLQLATSNGNVTDAAWSFDAGKWFHLAVTFDSATGATDVFINGVHKGATQYSNYRSSVNWGVNSFYIGKSYSDGRYFDGEMCEIRVWNRILTSDEINAKNHFYQVDPESDGLVAYWKANEGVGGTLTDFANGNNAGAKEAVTWKAVSLPEK